MSCSMSNEQNCAKRNLFNSNGVVQSMSNAIRCMDQRFEFKNSSIACLALTILDRQFCTQKSGCRLRNTSSNMTSNILFFSADWHKPMAKWLRWVWRHGFDSWMVMKLSSSPWPFLRGTKPIVSPSVHRHARFLYCCTLFNLFSWMLVLCWNKTYSSCDGNMYCWQKALPEPCCALELAGQVDSAQLMQIWPGAHSWHE